MKSNTEWLEEWAAEKVSLAKWAYKQGIDDLAELYLDGAAWYLSTVNWIIRRSAR